jgi:Rieske Fe-S protein
VKVDRRDFLKISGCAMVCTATGASICAAAQPFGVSTTLKAAEGSFVLEGKSLMLNLSKNIILKTPGNSIKLSVIDNKVITKIMVFYSDQGIYKAVPNKCTLGGMELEYKPEEKIIRCVSFGKSEFDLTGKVLKGPAPTPLKIYPVSVKSDNLLISLT